MEIVFEAARAIPAWEAGLKAGMILKKHGARYWSSCPMHRDKTPSLMLDEKGRWHCFSCGAGGDAAALYGALYGLKPIEAAKWLCADFGLAAPQSSGRHGPPAGKRAVTAMELKRAAEAFREREAARLLRIKFAARDEAAGIAGMPHPRRPPGNPRTLSAPLAPWPRQTPRFITWMPPRRNSLCAPCCRAKEKEKNTHELRK